MPRPPIGEKAMTPAERQRRHRDTEQQQIAQLRAELAAARAEIRRLEKLVKSQKPATPRYKPSLLWPSTGTPRPRSGAG
jgi:hypothetical protein